jgi:hypothetical protein
MSKVAAPPPQIPDDAPPPEKTAGFDGKRAYELVAKQVGFGLRPSGSQAIAQLQDFLDSELKSYGCTVGRLLQFRHARQPHRDERSPGKIRRPA